MSISVADIQSLRKRTGAGMMDCKEALTEAKGDMDKAIEIIRKKGQAFAAKRGDREATEGCVLASTEADYAALVSLNCETDFVAMNEDFIKLAQSILDAAMANKPANLEALEQIKLGDTNIKDLVIERMGITGEKMELAAFEAVEAPSVVAYIHLGNKLATIVGFNKENVDETVARDVAMQVAAMNPIALSADAVSEKMKEQERVVAREKALAEGKPANIVDRIVEGALNKFLKESTLLEQDFVKNPKQTIAQYLKESDKDLTVTEFKRFTLNAD